MWPVSYFNKTEKAASVAVAVGVIGAFAATWGQEELRNNSLPSLSEKSAEPAAIVRRYDDLSLSLLKVGSLAVFSLGFSGVLRGLARLDREESQGTGQLTTDNKVAGPVAMKLNK